MRRTHVLGSSVLVSESTAIGSVDFLNSHSLVYRTGSTLRTVSAATGETIWTRDRISPESLIFGDELRLSVVSLRNAHCQLFDIRTGTLLAEHFDIPLNGILATVGTDPIVRQIRSSTHLVSRFDMRSGTPIWEYELPGTAMIRPDNGNRLVELHRDGEILIREQSTGSVIIEVQGQKQLLPGVFFIHETPTGYVLFTATPQRDFQSQIRPLNLQGSRQDKVEGPAYGIDGRTGRLLWTAEIEPQFFTASQPRSLPFVVLACQSRRQPAGGFAVPVRSFPICVLDTRTGKTLFTADEDSEVMSFRSEGNEETKQAAITYGTTIVQLDYSGAKKDPKPQQD